MSGGACRECGKPLDAAERLIVGGFPRPIHRACHALRCARWREERRQAGQRELRARDRDPLNALLAAWRGPVTPEPMRWLA